MAMSSSPGSTASSSDLYSPSEHAGEDGSHQLVGNSPVEKESNLSGEQTPCRQGVSADVIRLPESPINGATGDWTIRDGDNQNPPSCAASKNQSNMAHQKRKREDLEEVLPHNQKHPSHPQRSQAAHDSLETLDVDAVQRSSALDDELAASVSSRIKRPKTGNQVTPVSNGTSHAQPSGLPVEIWQHIFSFVPPAFLGRLLRVSRVFYVNLTSATSEPATSETASRDMENQRAVRGVSADEVWAASRKRFAPGLPRPTLGLSELERMRLLLGRQCQICGEAKVQNFATSSESPLESGPGDKGVRVIWPFGVRSCGPCLHKCSEKVLFQMLRRTRKFTVSR